MVTVPRSVALVVPSARSILVVPPMVVPTNDLMPMLIFAATIHVRSRADDIEVDWAIFKSFGEARYHARPDFVPIFWLVYRVILAYHPSESPLTR